MLVQINRTHIVKDEKNKVISPLILAPHRRQSASNLKFHEDGIFSKKIFGKIHKCECGKVVGEGFCEECGCRVVSLNNMPDFYCDLGTKVSVAMPDYDNCGIDSDICEKLINYKSFLYDGDICELSEDNPSSNYPDNDKIKIGEEALLYLGVSQDWIDENTKDFVSISHPYQRAVVINDSNLPMITGINYLYSDLIEKVNNVKEMGDLINGRKLFLLVESNAISNIHQEIINALFNELQEVKYSIIKSEIISHPISGAIRATLTNRADLNEDVILIGDTFIETLFPYIYKKHKGNMIEINKDLIELNAMILLNRAPTIGELSIVAMYPRVASCYPYGKIDGTNGGLLHNDKYCEENSDLIGIFNDREGDIEKFSKLCDDGIDTLGLRCISVNPIMMDGPAGDFDGDVLLGMGIYSIAAKEDAKRMLPSNSYTNYANGTIRNHILNDFIFALD